MAKLGNLRKDMELWRNLRNLRGRGSGSRETPTIAVDDEGRTSRAEGTNEKPGSAYSQLDWTRIEALRDVHVISVAAGRDHSLVLDIRGRLYTFGRNDAGQLGIDSKIDMHTPQLVVVKDRRTCDSVDSNTISRVT